jgi:ribosome-binding protein aMBF1 (putative translation factor)
MSYERLRALVEEEENLTEAMAIASRIDAGEPTVPGDVVRGIVVEGRHPIAAWRDHRGLSQAALARKAGLSAVWIGRIESGGGYGSRETRRRLAEALGAPIWALEDERTA